MNISAFGLRGIVAPPAKGSVVVMRAGVNNRVRNVTVGQIEMAPTICESELQDPHARHAEILAELVDLLGDQAKILGDKWQFPKDLLEAVEQRVARRLDPLAIHCRQLFGRNGPVGLKTAEVIKSHLVVQRERAPNAGDPPVEAVFLQQRPLVERISQRCPLAEK